MCGLPADPVEQGDADRNRAAAGAEFSPARIAVILLRQIGDVLLVTPTLAVLRKRFPQAVIVAVVNDFTGPMLENNPDVDEVWLQNRGGIAAGWKLAWRMRRAGFDLTLDLTNGDRAALLSWCSGAPCRLAYLPSRSRWDWRRLAMTRIVPRPDRIVHQVERHMGLLRALGIEDAPGPLVLRMTPSEKDWASALIGADPRPLCIAHFVAHWLFKCWEDPKAAALIDWLQTARGFRVLLTCGPAAKEQERTQAILDACEVKPEAHIGNLGLRQLAALMERSRLFVGVDTAPMHMAAALGIPVAALFGPTDRVRWKPWSDRAVILAGPCRCLMEGKKGCPHTAIRDCLKAVTLEQAQQAIDGLLAQGETERVKWP